MPGRQHRDAIAKALRPIYTPAVNAAEAAAQRCVTRSRPSGVTAIRQQFDCGATRGVSSFRSWTTTLR